MRRPRWPSDDGSSDRPTEVRTIIRQSKTHLGLLAACIASAAPLVPVAPASAEPSGGPPKLTLIDASEKPVLESQGKSLSFVDDAGISVGVSGGDLEVRAARPDY